MTTTRIDHRNHNHPNTTAARKTCRDEIRAAHVAIDSYYGSGTLGPDPRLPVVVAPYPDAHDGYCMTCENPAWSDHDGYSECCNDRVTSAREIMDRKA